ncbi:DUF3237 domain-containing protein [Phenylobacterium sp.]|uniref:DUF3237 domain-containing protein n=1 Tax=Phenylobacterium sp. TaxID=1871053 RepID=UPI00374CC61A
MEGLFPLAGAADDPLPTMKTLRSEWLFSLYLEIGFDNLQKIGAAPIGWRGIYPVDGGYFEGPKLRGKVLPSGADWVTRRSDGATLLDVRLGLLTHDGATIAMSYTGLFRIADTAAERYRRGEPVTYAESYVRTTPRFETGDPRYDWLNSILGVANGGPPGSSPTYEVFAIL